jgi:amidase
MIGRTTLREHVGILQKGWPYINVWDCSGLEVFLPFVSVHPAQMAKPLRRLSSGRSIHIFSPNNKPAYVARDGERVVIETKDCFSGSVTDSKQVFEDVSMDLVNPATGPVEISGMVPGDTLCVAIENIRLGKTGVIMCSPELGNLNRNVRRSRTKIVKLKTNRATFSDDLEVELNPHIGVIGVSPSRGEFPTFHPGDYGGNMDTVETCEGSKVYLPVFIDGAMLAMGDVHAAMGDGEVCGTGIETSAEITVKLSKAEELELKRPMIETPIEWLSFAAAKTLDEAARLATSDMVRFIQDRRGIDFEEAYMIASVAANLKISQVVDPLMAAKMSISKRYL